MQAWLLQGAAEVPKLGEAPEPAPGADQIVLRVAACGVGTAERLVASGRRQRYHPGPFDYPHVPGFSVVGEVLDEGHGWSAGERVVVNGVLFCGHCARCLAGRQNVCSRHRLLGIDSGLPGGFAERVAVPVSSLFRLPGEVDAVTATMITEVATAVHLVRKAPLVAGERAVVIGFGRHGSAIAAVASALYPGLELSAIDPASAHRRVAGELGIELLESAAPLERRAAAAVYDCMGTGESIALALELLAAAGTVAVLGTTDRIVLDLDNPYGLLIQPEATIVGSLGKTPRDFAEAVHLVASGILPPGLTQVTAWPWRELEGAWAAPPTSRQAIVWDQG